MTFETRITQLTVVKTGDSPVYGESVTFIGIDDEAAGMFFTLEQEDSKLRITTEEWPLIVAAVERMIAEHPELKEP